MASADELLERDLHQLITALHASANRDLLTAIRRASLTLERLELLEWLRRSPVAPTVDQCAQAMHVAHNTASVIIGDMADRGLVKRTIDEDDARRRRVQITTSGEEILVQLHAARRPTIRAFINLQSDRCRQRLRSAIEESLAAATAV